MADDRLSRALDDYDAERRARRSAAEDAVAEPDPDPEIGSLIADFLRRGRRSAAVPFLRQSRDGDVEEVTRGWPVLAGKQVNLGHGSGSTYEREKTYWGRQWLGLTVDGELCYIVIDDTERCIAEGVVSRHDPWPGHGTEAHLGPPLGRDLAEAIMGALGLTLHSSSGWFDAFGNYLEHPVSDRHGAFLDKLARGMAEALRR